MTNFLGKMKEKEIKDLKEQTNTALDNLLNYLQKITKENEELQSEQWKDNELQRMKEKYNTMREDYLRGFPISETEDKKIRKWIKKHEIEKHHLTEDYKMTHKCCGAWYTYEFTPTSLGISGVIKCSCGDEFEFQSI
jgi:hypothetical protein